jgi:DNA transformation protein
MADDSFHTFVKELFEGLGSIQIKRMFGGAGVYADGLMFAMIAEDAVYLKADDKLKAALANEDSNPFVWTPGTGLRKGDKVEFNYWRLPDAAMDDPDEAVKWGRRALALAKAKAAAKPRRKAKAASEAKASSKVRAKTKRTKR